MSGVISGIKKVFTKVAPVVKKVLPIALAVGAVVFTAGAGLAAMGVIGGGSLLAGGWGGAVGSVVSGLGGTGALGSIITGAITQAGYGAAIGGAASMLMGGSFSKGAGTGALIGAGTGALSGAIGIGGYGPGLLSASAPAGAASQGAAATVTGAAANAAPSVAAATVGAAPTAASSGLGGGLGQFLGSTAGMGLVGNVAAGLGKGWMESNAAEARLKAEQEAEERKYQRIAQSYRMDPSVYHKPPMPDGIMRPTPSEAYPRRQASFQPGRYRYNPESGQIEFS